MTKLNKTEMQGMVKARCLQYFTHNEKDYAVNDIFIGGQEEVKTLAANGLIDPHKDAVSYIEGLK